MRRYGATFTWRYSYEEAYVGFRLYFYAAYSRGGEGERVTYTFDGDVDISEIRLVFDNDMNRKYHNMPFNYPLVETKFKLPKTLIKEYRIDGVNTAGEKFTLAVQDNHQRFVRHNVSWRVREISFTPISTCGAEDFRLFNFEVK